MSDNLKTYELVRKPPENALKAFNNGTFKGTDINSMWRIKMLTELYGVCGIGWYYTIDKLWMETAADGTIITFANISLYIKGGTIPSEDGWSKPIAGTGGNKFAYKTKGESGYLKVSDEAYKMAVTDAIGNATKSLGFGADIYWENDKTKYRPGAEFEDDKPKNPPPSVNNAEDEFVQTIRAIEELEAAWKDEGFSINQLKPSFLKRYGVALNQANSVQIRQAVKDMEESK